MLKALNTQGGVFDFCRQTHP